MEFLIKGYNQRSCSFGSSSNISVFLIFVLLCWAFNIPMVFQRAEASSVTDFKDTLSDSDLGVNANHAISFTLTNAVTGGQNMKIIFDPDTDRFNLSSLTNDDIALAGMTEVAVCGGGSDEVLVIIDSTAPEESIRLQVCAGDTVSAGAKAVTITNNHLTNPSIAGSYIIRLGGTMADEGDTRVYIVDDVVVTAEVLTTFTFTVTGVAKGATVNNDAGTTTASSTLPTNLYFGTLLPGVEHLLAHDLAVVTNARNGFVVTIIQDENLQSSTGADIDLFANGGASSTPGAWEAPVAYLDLENTYGHFGITSEDDLNTNEFGDAEYAGDFDTAREIFSHNGPADGSTANKGATRIGFKIEINALQEAASDYTNVLTYVATPTF